MTAFPATGYLSDPARDTAEMKQGLEDFLAAVKQLPGAGSAAEPTYTLVSDQITPAAGIFSIDTEGAGSTDNLAQILQTGLPEPSFIMLRAANASHVVTVKHNAGGSGTISLRGGVDFVLRTVSSWLLLKRTGTTWEEIGRFTNGAPTQDGPEVDVASASTCSIGTQTSSKVRITGTTGPITSFGAADAGILIVGRFASTPTITYNASSMILNTGGADYVASAGDRFIAESQGSGNWVVTFSRASGAAIVIEATSSVAPANGVYLPAANTVGFSTNTTRGFVQDASGRLIYGSVATVPQGPASNQNCQVQIHGITSQFNASYAASYWANDASSPLFVLTKSRGATVGSNVTVQSGDTVASFLARGADGTNYPNVGNIAFNAEGAISTGVIPGRFIISTANAAGAVTERMRWASDGLATLTGILKYAGTNTAGSGSAALGSNSPAVTNTAPYTWFQMQSSDGSTVYVPAWK